MKKVKTVLSFEYLGYIKNKAFIITTIIFAAVIIVGSQVPMAMGTLENMDVGTILGGGEKKTALIVLSGEAAAGDMKEMLTPEALDKATEGLYAWESGGPDSGTETGGTGDTGGTDDMKSLVEKDRYDVIFEYGGGKDYKIYGKGQDFTLSALPALLDPYLTEAARNVKMNALTADEQAGAKAVIDTTVAGSVDTVDGGDADTNFWLGYAMLYILFIVIVIYAQFIVSSVVIEKSSKTMELLVTSARPIELMFGKVLGVGLAAFTQMGVIVVTAVAAFLINMGTWEKTIPDMGNMLSSMNISAGLLVFFVLFFVIGYFQYAFISAAMGSTASRIEDAGTVSTLPSVLAVASFMVSLISMSNVEAPYVQVLSYIPLFSPWIMFGRLCMGAASFAEAAIAVLILIAAVLFFGWLSAKIYRVGVMMYGKPMKLKTVLKAALNKN